MLDKKQALSKLHELHSQVMNLSDEMSGAWKETLDLEDESFFQQAEQILSEVEATLSDFISENTEQDPSEEISDEELNDILEEEMYTEMDDDPEEFFKKNMDSED